ncbi:MAG: hypothetical protein BroJett025_00320 [Patescibacteria group bacterium]|nr:MAG: hypothetical protein BroJett025_00320 [Patescibacteria group bacterium]
MADANQLRATHTTFTYHGYSWELLDGRDLKITFQYHISPDITFDPSVTIHNVSQEMIDRLGKDAVDTYAFNLGMSELYSYWKATASPKIIVAAGNLSPEAIKFWQKLLFKGMGEFFYLNNIDFSVENFVTFTAESKKEHSTSQIQSPDLEIKRKVLVPVGGGKDSSVTLELLKNHFEVGTFTVSAPKAAQNIIQVSRIPQERQIAITRVLDPKIFELNESGYLNGHVPISAYLAFLSLLTADLFGYGYVAISNERSSNEGNVWYCDQEVNHQYSKSYEFERDLQEYVTHFLPNSAPLYFSFMRPLYELQIARIFAQFPDHHPVFRSCNRGQKRNIWCGNCSKCLFAWTILFPFLGPEKLTAYFGSNLFENEHLWPIAQELLGLSSAKPFDCVGTHEETIAAFHLSVNHCTKHSLKMPVLLEKVSHELETNVKLKTGPDGMTDYKERAQVILSDWNSENSLPEAFATILKQAVTTYASTV